MGRSLTISRIEFSAPAKQAQRVRISRLVCAPAFGMVVKLAGATTWTSAPRAPATPTDRARKRRSEASTAVYRRTSVDIWASRLLVLGAAAAAGLGAR